MARNSKKHTAYRKVCRLIGQPVDEFTERIRALIGEQALASAQVEAFNPKTNRSYTVTVAAAGCDRGADGELLLQLSESRLDNGGGGKGASAPAPEGGKGAAPSQGTARGTPVRKVLFKGRVQLPLPQSAPGGAASTKGAGGASGGGGGGGTGNGGHSAGRRSRGAPGLSSIAGVCMLCAVAAAGGLTFYASYMSQTADHGTINVIRAEVLDIDDSNGGRLIDLEIFASHTSCARAYDGNAQWLLYEEGDACNTWRSVPPEVVSYETSTGVHIVMDDYQRPADDREWLMIEIHTDTASIIHPVRVQGVR